MLIYNPIAMREKPIYTLPIRLRRDLGLIAVLELPLMLLSTVLFASGLDQWWNTPFDPLLNAGLAFVGLGYGLYTYKIFAAMGTLGLSQSRNLIWGNALYYVVMWAAINISAITQISINSPAIIMATFPILLLAFYYINQGKKLDNHQPEPARSESLETSEFENWLAQTEEDDHPTANREASHEPV